MNALTAIMLATITVTGNYPGYAATGLEEDHPAVIAALDAHTEPGICTDAIGSTVTDEARGFHDFPAVFLVDGACKPLPGNEWLEVF